MLRELKVENYAVIGHLDIAFHPGLNIITGETGAGKSILLGALSLLSGAKAEAGMIRQGAANLVVEGRFGIGEYTGDEDLAAIFRENEIDAAEEITIRRVVSDGGKKSRGFVDDIPVNVSVLRAIADRLVDIHSQHQTLLLGVAGFQTGIVDAVAGQVKLVGAYAAHFKQLKELYSQLKKAEEAAQAAVKERDYLQFQFDQLTELNLKSGETAELEQEQNRLEHAEEIVTVLNECLGVMNDDEQGINARVKQMANLLERLGKKYAPSEELASRMNSVYIELQDLARECEGRGDGIEIDPRRLEQVNMRLDTIYDLCRKHGVEDGELLIARCLELDNQLQAFDHADERIEGLQKEIAAVQDLAHQEAKKISTGRHRVAGEIKEHVERTLQELGIAQAVFEVSIDQAQELTMTGADLVTMRFSGNAGSVPQLIEQVASGGEMSRVMLALKGLVAQSMQLPTIIFDEIDQGVSGRVADKMGEIIARMGGVMQVLNITHLPQVAAKGDHHYHVEKDAQSGTRIRELERHERHELIATMLSGSHVTDAARKQAQELLKKS